MTNSNRPYILGGLSSIVNPANVNPSRDLMDIEKQMVNSGIIKEAEMTDPGALLSKDMQKLSSTFGLSYDTPKKKAPRPAAEEEAPEVEITSQVKTASSSEPATIFPTSYPTYSSMDKSPSKKQDEESSSESEEESFWPSKSSSELSRRTKEQQKSQQISRIMGDGGEEYGFDLEREEDERAMMIAEIDELCVQLANEIDLKHIPTIDDDTSMEQISRILRLLRRKNETLRLCGFAEESVLFLVHTLEDFFDGEKVWLGRYKPDLRGWNNHVGMKLRRMRYDVREVMSQVMGSVGINSWFRIALELIPNAFLYSKMKKQQTPGRQQLFDAELAESTRRLQNL